MTDTDIDASRAFRPSGFAAGAGGLSHRWAGIDELRDPSIGACFVPLHIPAAVMPELLAELPCFGEDTGSAETLGLSSVHDEQTKLEKLQAWLSEEVLPAEAESFDTILGALARDVLQCCTIFERAKAACSPRPNNETAVEYEVLMELVDQPGCTRFHFDAYVHTRLLRTYFGPTTEMVNNSDVNWEAFEAFDSDNAQSVPNLEAVQRTPAEGVLLLKGSKYHPGIPRSGCVHRSPGWDSPGWVFNSKGEPRRMLLRIDDRGLQH